MANARSAKSKPKKSAAKASSAHPVEGSIWHRHRRDLWVVALFVVGAFFALSLGGALGPVGRALSAGLASALGVARFALPVLTLGLAAALVANRVEIDRTRLTWGGGLALLAVSGMGDLAGGMPGLHASRSALGGAGGWLGVAVGGGLASALAVAGAVVVLVALALVSVMVLTGIGLRTILLAMGRFFRAVGARLARWWASRPQSNENYDEVENEAAVVPFPQPAPAPEPVDDVDDDPYEAPLEADYEDDPYEDEPEPAPAPAAPALRLVPDVPSNWELPPLSLLSRTKEQKQDRNAVDEAGAQLVTALAAHGVDTTLVGYTVGPTVTRFELELGPGVKVSKVTSLNKDIAYAMASPDVRILAPIPGRSAIGVEVPNRQRSLVALGDLLAAEESLAATHPLDVPIGRDISGRTVVVNLSEMPHVLISGATGAGKSSCLNSLITSLVMRATPDQLGLILIDPKRVEMGQYGDLPHLLSPVVVDPKKAAGALAWAVKEMERRYDILAEVGARDITSYQQMIDRGEIQLPPTAREEVADALERATGLETELQRPEPERLRYIVVVVDELNDLMMVAARDVEDSVVRIAQMARAVGIHLVLATQRPSVDVITGVIKANIPSRMAFAVSSLADSRVILDQAGAERLIGKGDMLLLTASSNIARRLQSPWVSEEEVRRVVEAWRAQGGRRETVVALDEPVRSSAGGGGEGPGVDDEELFREARRIVIETQSGSTSMLQRKLRVGFARAGRLMDELEKAGIVGPGDGSKARKVLKTIDDLDD